MKVCILLDDSISMVPSEISIRDLGPYKIYHEMPRYVSKVGRRVVLEGEEEIIKSFLDANSPTFV